MKKVLAICLVMVMVMGMAANVFAVPNGFMSSPSAKRAPTVVSFDTGLENCNAELVVTPYGDKNDLPEALQTVFQKAYDEIVASEDLTKLNEGLAKLAEGKKIEGKNLAVSDLFDIHLTDCDYHEEHFEVDITLDAETLSHFVALLHMNKDGEWELVEDAKVINNGEHLDFTVESLSPFAVVVEMDAQEDEPRDWTWLYILIALIVVAVVVVIVVKSKKKKA